MSLAFSRSGRFVMAGFFDGTVRVWDLANDARETVFNGHTFQVRGLGLLPDERTLISASTEIRVWDLVTGRELFQLSPRPRNMLGVAISPDGRRLAVGASDGLTTLWDTASWHELATLPGHTAELFHLAFTPDGQTLLSASREPRCYRNTLEASATHAPTRFDRAVAR